MYPCIVLIINILMSINVIVRVNIRHIIIPGMVISNRAPVGLAAYVYTNTKAILGIGHFE